MGGGRGRGRAGCRAFRRIGDEGGQPQVPSGRSDDGKVSKALSFPRKGAHELAVDG